MFGVKLGVPYSQLKKIESSHHEREIELCKIDMLHYWLDNNLVTSWNEVILALEEIDEVAQASQIKHDYLLSAANDKEGIMLIRRHVVIIICISETVYYQIQQELKLM